MSYNEKALCEELYIVLEEYNTLLGRTWIRHLEIDLQEVDSKKKNTSNDLRVQSISYKDDIISSCPEIFVQKVGCILLVL